MQWIKRDIDPDTVRSVSKRWELSLMLAAILNRRDMSHSENELYYFVRRNINEQHNPFLLYGIIPAIQRIDQAWKKKERILIFGDRDVDGMTATVVLTKTLRALGLTCEWRVPTDNEQYGLSSAAVEYCVENHISLIITVDCGVSNFVEIDLAKQHAIDTIVLDHHNVPDTIPPALAMINPKQEVCRYPYPLISGCTVAYKFVLAMQCYADTYKAFDSDADGQTHDVSPTIDLDMLLRAWAVFIEQKSTVRDELFCEIGLLTAISIVADMMPLLNENRIIVNDGIRHISDCKSEGAHALLRKKELLATDVTARALAFNVIPLLNAAGRFGKADLAIQLLLSTSAQEADTLTNQIIATHKQQKNIIQQASRTCYTQARESHSTFNGHYVVVYDENIPNTVTGLFANKLQRDFDATAIVIARNSQKISGSIRCIGERRATDFTNHFSEFFSNYGGHDRAAGFTILPDKYDYFIDHLSQYLQQQSKMGKPANAIQIDAEVPRALLTNLLFDDNDLLEPFGQAFPPVIYYTKEVVISNIDLLGKDERHAKLLLYTGTVRIPAIFWNCGKYFGTVLRPNNTVDVLYNLEYNHFRHNKEKRLSIIDVSLHGEQSV